MKNKLLIVFVVGIAIASSSNLQSIAAEKPSVLAQSSPIEVHIRQDADPSPTWLKIVDKLIWPLVVLLCIVIFRVQLGGVLILLGKGGAEFTFGSLALKLKAQGDQIADQQGKLAEQSDRIRNLIKYSMSVYIYGMLVDLKKAKSLNGEYIYRNNGSMDRNIRFLIDHGYMKEIGDMPHDGQNMVPIVEITPSGEDVIAMRGY